MPLLDRRGEKPDVFTRADLIAGDTPGHLLVGLEALPAAFHRRAPGQRIGVQVPNTTRAADLRFFLKQLSLIAIAFPAFSDGRGFSLARALRDHGFGGVLRASGPLIADQFAYALAVGFDEVELPDALAARQPVEQWLAAAGSFSRVYQRGYAGRVSILDLRRLARRATGTGG